MQLSKTFLQDEKYLNLVVLQQPQRVFVRVLKNT